MLSIGSDASIGKGTKAEARMPALGLRDGRAYPKATSQEAPLLLVIFTAHALYAGWRECGSNEGNVRRFTPS